MWYLYTLFPCILLDTLSNTFAWLLLYGSVNQRNHTACVGQGSTTLFCTPICNMNVSEIHVSFCARTCVCCRSRSATLIRGAGTDRSCFQIPRAAAPCPARCLRTRWAGSWLPPAAPSSPGCGCTCAPTVVALPAWAGRRPTNLANCRSGGTATYHCFRGHRDAVVATVRSFSLSHVKFFIISL